MEQQAITIISDSTEITLVNVYIPPVGSCPDNFTANITHLLALDDCIIMGDVNVHHTAWQSELADDSRGSLISDQIDQSLFGILNDDSPTRITANCRSSPDLTLASASLLTCTDWVTKSALHSDHVPIIVSLQRTVTKCTANRKAYINLAKAD